MAQTITSPRIDEADADQTINRTFWDNTVQFVKAWAGEASFSRDAIASFGIHIFSAVISLVTTLILARLIGAANYGIYGVALVYANVFAYMSCLGFADLIIRTEARDSDQKSGNVARDTQRTALVATIVAGLVLAGFGLTIGRWLVPAPAPNSAWAFAIGMAMVAPIAYQRLAEATLLGRHQPILSLLPERIIRTIAMLVLVMVLAIFASSSLGANQAVAVQAAAYMLSISGAAFLVFRTTPKHTTPHKSRFQPAPLRDAVPFLL
nr:oligosaccharide flippase family protein [Alphaproteobacteria bacterium]